MRRTVTILLVAGALGLSLAACAKPVSPAESPASEDVVVVAEVAPEAPPPEQAEAPPPEQPEAPPPEEPATLGETGDYEIKTTAAGVRYIVDPAKILGGGPPKDGIPSIDDPKYVSVTEADGWIDDNELVLTISYKGVVRVYPLQIMVWHEIVNDVIAGDPILITY